MTMSAIKLDKKPRATTLNTKIIQNEPQLHNIFSVFMINSFKCYFRNY